MRDEVPLIAGSAFSVTTCMLSQLIKPGTVAGSVYCHMRQLSLWPGHKPLVCTTCQGALLVQEAEEQLDEGQVGFIPEASAMTHKQVLEMAVAEASRRVHEATRYAHCTTLVSLHQSRFYTQTYITILCLYDS